MPIYSAAVELQVAMRTEIHHSERLPIELDLEGQIDSGHTFKAMVTYVSCAWHYCGPSSCYDNIVRTGPARWWGSRGRASRGIGKGRSIGGCIGEKWLKIGAVVLL